MTVSTPKHRAGFAARSGDTQVIGADGKLTNVDAEARKEAKRAEAKKKPSVKAGAAPTTPKPD